MPSNMGSLISAAFLGHHHKQNLGRGVQAQRGLPHFIIWKWPLSWIGRRMPFTLKGCLALLGPFPGGSVVKNSPGEWGFDFWVRKIPWRRKGQPTLVFLPGESHEQRTLVGYSPWGCRVGHDWATERAHTSSSFSLLFQSSFFLLPTPSSA